MPKDKAPKNEAKTQRPRPKLTLALIEKHAGKGAGDYPPGYLEELHSEWR
jgi:hypothetical protein